MIGKDHSLYHSLMKTSIGVQMFVRQSNHLYETHFVHCEEINHLFEQRMEFQEEKPNVSRVVEGYVQEARLSRWSADFYM
jgi:hypothetical protein